MYITFSKLNYYFSQHNLFFQLAIFIPTAIRTGTWKLEYIPLINMLDIQKFKTKNIFIC